MLVSDLLTTSRIKVPIEARDKPGVLRELAALVAEPDGDDVATIVQAVEEREAVLSTGIGHGVAIPHGKPAVSQELRVAAGASPEPIAFDALDGQPVRLFFLLVGPESAAADHIKALSRIARLTRQTAFRDRLLSARTPQEFYRYVCDAEGR